MAKIINYLDNIKNAMFGKDVRSSIHDGIAAINEEVESTTARQKVLDSTFEQLTINAGSSNAEIVAGRTNAEGKSFDTIGKRLNSFDSQIKETANYQMTLNVVNNGAKGDGVTDDTKAIKSAISMLSNYGTLFFPQGKYRITDNILIDSLKNITIKGDGAETTIIYNDSVDKDIKLDNCHFISIKNLSVYGNGKHASGTGATNGNGITFNNCSHINFNKVDIRYNGGCGIFLHDNCWVYNFSEVRFIGNLRDGFSGVTINELQATAIYFSNCLFWHNGVGIRYSGACCSINNSIIENNGVGIWLDSSNGKNSNVNILINGCDFEQNKREQIKISTNSSFSERSIIIDGCNFVNIDDNIGTEYIVIDDCGNYISGFELRNNSYFNTENFDILNANNKLYSDCIVYSNHLVDFNKFKNLGNAKLKHETDKVILNGLFDQSGIDFKTYEHSEELKGLSNVVCHWKLPYVNGGYLGGIKINIDTDCSTNYTVVFDVNYIDSTGKKVPFCTAEKTFNNNITDTSIIGLSVPPGIQLILTTWIKTMPTDGTKFRIKNIVIDGTIN